MTDGGLTTDLTTDNFGDVALAPGIALVDFWASWCVPCRMFAPVYERAAGRHTDVMFGTVDIDAEPELTARFKVSSVPTLMAIRDGVVVYARPGALSDATLDELISKVRELDMDDVRRHVRADASHQAEHDTDSKA